MDPNSYLWQHLAKAKQERYQREAELARLALAQLTGRLAGWLERRREGLEESRPILVPGYPERAS